jgi:nicotinamidase-related amidase
MTDTASPLTKTGPSFSKTGPSFTKTGSVLVVVDIQEVFRSAIFDMERVIANSSRLARFCTELKIPVVVTEQYPAKLGATVEEIRGPLGNPPTIEKLAFSCAGATEFTDRLGAIGNNQVILCGIETHVCVYQTARDLVRRGYQVALAADAVSSRLPMNREIGIETMRDLGVQIMSTEMLMFEILEVALTDDFRAVSSILRENPDAPKK